MKRFTRNAAPGAQQEEAVLCSENIERLREGLKPSVSGSTTKIVEPLVDHYSKYISDILHIAGLPRKYDLVSAYQRGKLATFKIKQDELYITVQIDNSKTSHINIIIEHHLPRITKETTTITLPTPTERARKFNLNIIYMPYAKKFYKRIGDDSELVVETNPQFILGMAALITEDKNLFLAFARKYFLNNRKDRFADVVCIRGDKKYDLYKNIDERGVEKYARKVAIIAFHSYLPDNDAHELPITLLISNANVHANTTYTYTFDKDGVTYTYVVNVFATRVIYVDRDKNVLYTPYANLRSDNEVLEKFMRYHNVARVATELPFYSVKDGRLIVYNVWEINIEDILKKYDVEEVQLNFEQIKKIGLSVIKRARKARILSTIKATYAKYYYDQVSNKIYLIVLAYDERYGSSDIGVIAATHNGFPVVVLIAGREKYYEIINKRMDDVHVALHILDIAYKTYVNKGRQTILDYNVISAVEELVSRTHAYLTSVTVDMLEFELNEAARNNIIKPNDIEQYLALFDKDPIRTLEELVEKGIISLEALQ